MTNEEYINQIVEIGNTLQIQPNSPKGQTLKKCIELLSAVPEREKKEWIAYDHGMGLVYLKCPFCGATIDKRYVEHNFCGKCGAKLSGEKSGFER